MAKKSKQSKGRPAAKAAGKPAGRSPVKPALNSSRSSGRSKQKVTYHSEEEEDVSVFNAIQLP